MCGFLGNIAKFKIDNQKLQTSNELQSCRGPDETKFFEKEIFDNSSNNFYSSFFFNRLAIQDLSSSGSQPMYSDFFNTLILFNGEIFNHSELRTSLIKDNINFNSQSSDTEVVLNGLSKYGLSFIEKLVGQFSIFFINFNTSEFYLIRDRLGQKPLFFNFSNEQITFGTNLKSLIFFQSHIEIDEKSLIDYIEFGVVPAPNTLFKNIKKVMPGEVYIGNFLDSNITLTNKSYWKPEKYISNKFFSKKYFLSLLHDSIEIRSKADVDISSFLSGGLDSTYIAKILKTNSNFINSFTVSFNDSKYDESVWAKEVIHKYQLNSKIIEFDTSNLGFEIMEAINSLDEPYSDPSIIPSYIISKKISEDFKVAISGDGGDELFFGYDRTIRAINGIKFSNWFINILFYFYPYIFGSGAKVLSKSNNLSVAYRSFLSDIKLRKNIFGNKTGHFDFGSTFIDTGSVLKTCLLSDFKFYLPEMMLLKIDRTSMANSLEVRSPFVDHRLVEYILSTDIDTYLDGERKKFLKEELKNDFNKNFIYRKKQGFVFDVENWVYNNSDVESTIKNGYLKNYNSNIYRQLSYNKSIQNAQRIWKIYTLEKYLSSISELINT